MLSLRNRVCLLLWPQIGDRCTSDYSTILVEVSGEGNKRMSVFAMERVFIYRCMSGAWLRAGRLGHFF